MQTIKKCPNTPNQLKPPVYLVFPLFNKTNVNTILKHLSDFDH